MAKKTLKEKINAIVNNSGSPLTKGDIEKGLRSPKPSDRTLKRTLASMVAEGTIEKHGERAASTYSLPSHSNSFLIDEPLDPQAVPDQQNFEGYRSFIRQYIKSRKATPIFYDPQRLESYNPGETTLLPKSVADSIPTERNNELLVGSTYSDEVVATFLKLFTFNSSRLEGVTTTLASTEEILSKNDPVDENSLIIVNHGRATDWLVKCSTNPEFEFANELSISAKPIAELHTVLMDGLIKGDREGLIRDGIVKISGSFYAPMTSPDELEKNLNLVAIKGSKISNPLERAFFFLLFVSYLQPFWDGNKRTARLLSNFPLLSSGLSPNPFHGVNEDDYLNSIVYYYETGDHRPLAVLWGQSYLEGMSLFVSMENRFKDINETKVIMHEDRKNVVKKVVNFSVGRQELKGIVEEVWSTSKNKDRYDSDTLLAQVIIDLNKLAKTSLGLAKYDLSPEIVETWSKVWE